MNQLTVQIRELQDKVKSLNDSRDFHDLETASSSGLSHVPSLPYFVPSYFGKSCRYSCPQPDTRNSYGTPGNVFKNPSASDEPTASCSENVYAISPNATHGEPGFLDTRRSVARTDEINRDTQSFTVPTPRSAENVSTWDPPSHAQGAYSQNCMVETSEESGLGNAFP